MWPISPLIIGLLASVAAQRPSHLPGERLEIRPAIGELVLTSPSDYHDVGTVLAMEPAEHTFRLEVEGGPVRILKLRPSTSCTIPPLKVQVGDEAPSFGYVLGQPLSEGTTVELTVRMGTAAVRGSKAVSAWIDWAPLMSTSLEEPATRTEKVRVAALVRPFFIVDPPFHSLGEIPLGESRTVTSLIRTTKERPFLLELNNERKIVDDRVRTWLRPLHARPDGYSVFWQLTFEVDGRARVGGGGQLARIVLVDMDGGDLVVEPGRYTAGSNVNFRVVGPFSFVEDVASFGLFRPEMTVERDLELRVPERDFDPSQLRFRIEPDPERPLDKRMVKALESVTCDVVPRESEGDGEDLPDPEAPTSLRLRLRVRDLPPSLDGALRGRLVVETGDRSFPELSALFVGVCRVLTPARKR
jgi:hypothetical protein